MDIDKIISQTATDCGLNSYFYARIKEANLRLSDIHNYPILWRQFNDQIRYTELKNEREIRTTFHFLDQLPNHNPDTESEVLPIIRRMDGVCRLFLESLKAQGVKFRIAGITVTPTVEYARSLSLPLAGVRCEVTFRYNTCK